MNKDNHRRILSRILVVFMVFMLLVPTDRAHATIVPLVNSTDGWTISTPENDQFDYVGDQQTGSGSVSQDIVGNSHYPAFYTKYDSNSSEIAFRIRINAEDNGNSFNNFAFVGVDANNDGKIEFFVGVYSPTGNGRIGIYNADPNKANQSPNTTGIINPPIKEYVPSRGVNYSLMVVNDGSNFTGARNSSGDPDYFITFKIPIDDINAAMSTVHRNITVTTSSPLRYIIGTAAQDNSFNQDVGGIQGIDTKDTRTWDSLGVFSPVQTIDGRTLSCTVSFNTNGGGSNPPSQTVDYGLAYGTLPLVSRTGYTFDGWYTVATGGSKVSNTDLASGDITLYAHWIGNSHQVSFNTEGGDGRPSSQTVTYGSAYGTLPSAGSKTGYTFEGWYTDETYTTKVTSTTVVTNNADETLYAHWIAGSATITLDPNHDSEATSTVTRSYGSAYSLNTSAPTRTGYTFDGWYTAATGGSKVSSTDLVSGDITLYAHWVGNTHQVSFNAEGGNGTPGAQTVTYGSAYGTLPSAGSKTGYTFDGWYTNEAYTTKVTSATIVTSNADEILYVHWVAGSATITLDPNHDSEATSTVTRSHGSTYSLSAPTLLREGYTFDGWYTAATGGSKVSSTDLVSGDITLYAHWIGNSHQVSFNTEGGDGTPSAQPVTYGSAYGTLPSAGNKTGYTFEGWYTDETYTIRVISTTVVTNNGDETLYAHWIGNGHQVSFNTEGGDGTPSAQSATYGLAYGTLPSAGSKIGYTFEGWYTDETYTAKVISTTVVTNNGDETLYAHWTGNGHQVSFNTEGGSGTPSAQPATYGLVYGTLPSAGSKTGYIFEGWYRDESYTTKVTSETIVSINADEILYAHWVAGSATITLDPNHDSEAISTITRSYGSAYSLNASAPTRTGYTFDGWYTAATGGSKVSNTDLVTGDITLYAHWIGNSHQVSFNAEGGDGTPSAQTVTYGLAYGTLPSAGSRAGYTFEGWYIDETYTTEVTSETIVSINADEILYAHWVAGSATITLDPNHDSEAISTITRSYGSAYSLNASAPTRTGYTFDGWYTAATGGSKVSNTDLVTGDITLYAHWIGNSHQVSFNAEGGDGTPSAQTVTYGLAYGTLPSAGSRAGYTFEGWYIDETYTTEVTSTTVVTNNGDETLYAHWTANSHQVSFNTEGGDGTPSAQTVTYGSAYGTLPSAGSKTGYTFEGWYTDKTYTTKVTSETIVSINADEILYAHWVAGSATITLDPNHDSEAISTITRSYGSAYSLNASAPTRTGYTFDGWYTAATGGSKVSNTDLVTGDITLYAHWIGNSHQVSFNTEGGDGRPSAQTVTYELAYGTLPSAGSKAGYTFEGWYIDETYTTEVTSTTVVTNNADETLYAHWTANTHQVSFNTRGGSGTPSAQPVTYRSPYGTLPSAGSKTGYTFEGWYTDETYTTKVTSETIVTSSGDETLYAHWTANAHQVSFNTEGGDGTPSAQSATYGSAYGTLPSAGSKTGYTFEGWYTDETYATKATSETIVTSSADEILYAHWISVATVTTSSGIVVDEKGNQIQGVETEVTTETDGTKTVAVKAYDAILLKAPDGTINPLSDFSKLGFSSTENVTISSDGTIKFKNLTNGTETKVNVTFDLGNGQKIIIGTIDVKVSDTGDVSFVSTLIDPYGIITDSVTGKAIDGVNVTLYYANTDRNIASGKTLNTVVRLPIIDSLKSNNNNPQLSDTSGSYGFMVFPNTDYYIVAAKDGYNEYVSPTISVEQEIVKFDIVMDELVSTYTVTFDSNGGSTVDPITNITSGSAITLPIAPTKEGYNFSGWNTEQDGNGTVFNETTPVCSNETVYAQWTTNPTFTVIFDSNGGSEVDPITNITSGSAITLPAAPTKTGYTFEGWNTAANGNGIVFTASTPVYSNQTVYAKWVQVKTTTSSGIVLDENGNKVQGVETTVTTEANGNKTVEVKSQDAILLKSPDGTLNPIVNSSTGDSSTSGFSKIGFSLIENPNATISIDSTTGIIKVKNLANGTESKVNVSYDLGNGQKIIIGTIDVTVTTSGAISFVSTLIDPYGIITDSVTGKPIDGVNITLYYANTDRNKDSGKTPDAKVVLPPIDGFKPNNNANSQTSDVNGSYGYMVFPTTDYYLVAIKDGYDKYVSPTIPVEQEIVKFDITMNQSPTASGGSVSGGGSGSSTTLSPTNATVERISGQNRIDTALAIAKATYKEKVSKVILASSSNFPDALAGSVLAYKIKAPILLVGSSDEDQQKILDYMKSNMESTGTVYILGGTGVVSKDMERKIADSGFVNVTRLGGADRYETAVKIADELGVKEGTPIVIVSGENYPDAISVSSTAAINQYPILMVRKDEISDMVKNKIAAIKPSKIYIIGLQGAVSTEVENQSAETAALDKVNAVRIGGENRFDTSLNVAKYFKLSGTSICVASGNNFPDALVGSSYAAEHNAPIMLIDESLSDNEILYLENNNLSGVTIFGGEGVVSKEILQQISQILGK